MTKVSKRRLEMGEDAWAEYQHQRKNAKASKYFDANVEKVLKSRRKKKRLLVEYKGGQCERCGFKSDVMDVYDFHHKDPKTKEFGLSDNVGKNASLERCKIEADKCLLVCRNCHVTIHYELTMKKYDLD